MWLFRSQSYQSFLQSAVETFDHPVCLGMVGRGHYRLDPPDSRQLLKDLRAELRAPIRCDGCGDAECLYPAKREAVDDALGCDVREGDCDWPAGKSIHHGEKIFESIREGQSDQIDVDV